MFIFQFIIYKFFNLLSVLAGIILILFLIAKVIPGDPARAAAGPGATIEQLEKIRKEYSLDQPTHIQIYRYFKNILSFNLGKSIWSKKDVWSEIKLFLPASLELVFSAMFINIFFGVLLGVYSAINPGKIIDKLSRLITILGMGLPIFWVGIMAQLLFYHKLEIFPSGGRLPASVYPPEFVTGSYIIDSLIAGDFNLFITTLHHLFLPALIISLPEVAVTARIMRNSMLNTLNANYITAAQSRGIKRKKILFVHALKNAIMIPISLFGMQTGWILGGTLLVESVFSWGGLGFLAYTAIYKRDFPIIIGVTLVISTCFVICNTTVDVIHKLIDKRNVNE